MNTFLNIIWSKILFSSESDIIYILEICDINNLDTFFYISSRARKMDILPESCAHFNHIHICVYNIRLNQI